MVRQGAPRWRDAALPLALVVVGGTELAFTRPGGWGFALALEIVSGALLTAQRRSGLLAPTLAGVILLQMPWLGPQLDSVAAPILFLTVICYGLGRWVADLRGLAGLAVILATVGVDYAFVDARTHGVGDLVFVCTLALPPYVFGRMMRALDDRRALLERNQELVALQAARAERDRIARELHDVIAHSVSAMVVQTAAAQDLVHPDPDAAALLLADVAGTGRQALAETGRLLHVLRDDADELGLRPAPGLADLDDLVQGFRTSGLHVDLVLPDPLPQIPPGVDVSAYRIIQEALTNALKHGSNRTASASLTVSAETVSIRTSNPQGQGGVGAGLGLRGMAERVSLLGGDLAHGVDEDGRFVVSASLPLTQSDPS